MIKPVEILIKKPVSGGLGFLIGLVAVWWVEPTTAGGVGLLIVICVIASMIIGGMLSWLVGKKNAT